MYAWELPHGNCHVYMGDLPCRRGVCHAGLAGAASASPVHPPPRRRPTVVHRLEIAAGSPRPVRPSVVAMFGRRPSPDSDASAVARRRLAALAAQFEVNGSVPTALAQHDPIDGTEATTPAATPWQHEPIGGTEAAAPATAPGRHNVPAAGADHPARLAPEPLDGGGPTGGGSSSSGSAPGRHAARRLADEYGRWNLTTHQVTVVALIVAAVVALAGWWVLRSVPEAAPVQLASERSLPTPSSANELSLSAPPVTAPTGGALASPVGAPTGGALASPVGAATGGDPLVVDVAGKVRRPGIVELPAGSRVVDAIHAAGGARRGVNTTSLNLARQLIDGEQIVVGLRVPAVDLVPPPSLSGAVIPDAIVSIDLNAASQEELETLPGIGPVTAASILAWRTENGAFSNVDELLEVSGIGDVTLADIEDYVHV